MNPILKKYNLLVSNYQEIEKDSTVDAIHDKRVILRRVFSILAACDMKPSKVKNGEKAFELFGKLRDVQVQLLKLESFDPTPEMTEYLAFLKERELKFREKVDTFCRKKELDFPAIKKKNILDRTNVFGRAEKSLRKLIETIHSHSIDDAEDIHQIRIEFKKFRYKAEILSYLEEIDEAKLDLLKMYQDKLGEIQDYEVLINGIKKYCKKRKLDAEEMTDLFEHDQNTLIENFDDHIELFIVVCRDVLELKNEQPDLSAEAGDREVDQICVEDNVIVRTDDPDGGSNAPVPKNDVPVDLKENQSPSLQDEPVIQ